MKNVKLILLSSLMLSGAVFAGSNVIDKLIAKLAGEGGYVCLTNTEMKSSPKALGALLSNNPDRVFAAKDAITAVRNCRSGNLYKARPTQDILDPKPEGSKNHQLKYSL